MAVVLFAALLHASWNALIKACGDKLLMTWLLCVCAGVLAALFLPFLPAPQRESWGHLAASGTIHLLYFWLVSRAYQSADMSLAYPLMRGAAPILTALIAVIVFAEPLSAPAWLGIALLCGGVITLALQAAGAAALSRTAWQPAIINAGVIVLYTLIDGAGARLAGDAAAYACWLFVLTALPMVLMFPVMRPRWRTSRRDVLPRGAIAGACSLASYGLALWAMTQAPVALVAALRETSVLFGALLAALLLHEKFGAARWAAAGLVAAGAALFKIA